MSSQPTNEAGRQAWIRYSNRVKFTVRTKVPHKGWALVEYDVVREPFKTLASIYPDDWGKVPPQLLPVDHTNKE